MSEITAGGRSPACQHSRALKRRTITGTLLAAGVVLQQVSFDSLTTVADIIEPSLVAVTVTAGVIFVADVAIAAVLKVKKWFKNRVIVLDLSSRDRPPGQE